MARNVFEYNPANIVLNFNGNDITGFADGTFVKVERNVEAFSLVVGSDGEATRVKSQNLSGRFTFTLQQSSPSNDDLSAAATLDEQSSSAVYPTLMTEVGGASQASASKSWVVKKAATEFGKESGNREWIIETHNLTYAVGGTTPL